MILTTTIKENEGFEKVLRSEYDKDVCDIVIEWVDEALKYKLIETDKENLFLLDRINANPDVVTYLDIKTDNEEYCTCEEVISRVIEEMQDALDDEGNESREDIEEELRVLSRAL